MSSVVGKIVEAVRVSLGVTTVGLGLGRPRQGPNVGRVSLERRRQAGANQASSRDRLIAEPVTNGIGRLDHAPTAGVVGREQCELVSFAEARRAYPKQADPEPPDLGPRKLEGRSKDGIGQVGRLGQGSLSSDRSER